MSCRIFAIVASVLAAWVSAASGAEPGRTPEGINFIVGGVGLEDATWIDAESVRHPLALRTAARGSGAYITDVDVQIFDAHGVRVFQQRLDAPWLLIDLPPGRYKVLGVYDDAGSSMSLSIPAHGHRAAVLYFDIPGETRPFRSEEP